MTITIPLPNIRSWSTLAHVELECWSLLHNQQPFCLANTTGQDFVPKSARILNFHISSKKLLVPKIYDFCSPKNLQLVTHNCTKAGVLLWRCLDEAVAEGTHTFKAPKATHINTETKKTCWQSEREFPSFMTMTPTSISKQLFLSCCKPPFIFPIIPFPLGGIQLCHKKQEHSNMQNQPQAK